jgi:hypothetical protein
LSPNDNSANSDMTYILLGFIFKKYVFILLIRN